MTKRKCGDMLHMDIQAPFINPYGYTVFYCQKEKGHKDKHYSYGESDYGKKFIIEWED